MMNQKTAILLGATGLTGRLLLSRLIAEDSYASIKLFSRKASGNTSPKIKEFVGDMLQLEHFKKDFTADEVFCCIGTTSSKTKDRAVYRAIDFGIPFTAAKLAKENNLSIQQLDLRNSGDTAGDKQRVVGYGSWSIYAE